MAEATRDELFPYPTVKEVDFEIRYPILFSIENKIGDFQQLILNEFPEAQQVFEKVFSGAVSIAKESGIDERPEMARKLWLFKSGTGHEVRISSNSLVIFSTQHKTYDNINAPTRFRDVIESVTTNFFKIVNIPVIRRVGLRYIDHIPLPTKDNATLERLYHSSLPYERFPIQDVASMCSEVRTTKGNHRLVYKEALTQVNGKETIILDFDGFEEKILSTELLRVADELHSIIKTEYFNIIGAPVLAYMRTGRFE